MMKENHNPVLRSLGWVALVVGLLLVGGAGLLAFVTDDSMSLFMKLTLSAIYGGLLILLVSVLRQRLRERKTDKYKDVEI